MSQITALISGSNQNYDYQLTAIARAVVNPGVISGLGVTTGSVAAGEGFILATRTNGQQIMIHYTNTAAVTIDTTGTKKVWIGISQAVIDDGSTNAVDGSGIATIQTGASYPVTGAYIPLASITSGVITDARNFLTGKPIDRSGYPVNKTTYIDPALGKEVVKDTALGSSFSDTDIILSRTSAGNENRVPFSGLKNQLSSVGKYLQSVPLGESISAGTPTALAVVPYPVVFTNTLGSNIAGGRVKSGIRFSVPYSTTLGVVKSSQLQTSVNARMQLLDDTGALIVEQAKKADDVNFIPTLTANTQSGYTLTTDCPDQAYYAFDNNSGTNTYTGNVAGRYIKVMMPGKKKVTRASLSGMAGTQTIASATVYGILADGVTEVLLTTTGVISSTVTNWDFTEGEYYGFKVVFGNPSGSYSGSYNINTINFSWINPGDIFDFGIQAITQDIIYRLVENDSSYFNANNNELALASYQAGFKFCISGTSNGVNSVLPQNIKEIQLSSKKAMKAIANSSEYVVFAGFATGTKDKGDLVNLDSNDGTLVSGFSGLSNTPYYVSNTAGVISSSPGTISHRIGLGREGSNILISYTAGRLG